MSGTGNGLPSRAANGRPFNSRVAFPATASATAFASTAPETPRATWLHQLQHGQPGDVACDNDYHSAGPNDQAGRHPDARPGTVGSTTRQASEQALKDPVW